MKKKFILGVLAISLVFTGCTVGVLEKICPDGDNPSPYNNNVSQEVVIGDELIYGDEYSFENVYKAILGEVEESARSISNSRSAASEDEKFELCEDDVIEMVYFSVHPSI